MTGPRHVPTVAELVARGMARGTSSKGETTRYQISDEGYAEIFAAMKWNAENYDPTHEIFQERTDI